VNIDPVLCPCCRMCNFSQSRMAAKYLPGCHLDSANQDASWSMLQRGTPYPSNRTSAILKRLTPSRRHAHSAQPTDAYSAAVVPHCGSTIAFLRLGSFGREHTPILAFISRSRHYNFTMTFPVSMPLLTNDCGEDSTEPTCPATQITCGFLSLRVS
jgi:hypothetical protein